MAHLREGQIFTPTDDSDILRFRFEDRGTQLSYEEPEAERLRLQTLEGVKPPLGFLRAQES